jgi:hypothetical protein
MVVVMMMMMMTFHLIKLLPLGRYIQIQMWYSYGEICNAATPSM